MMTGKVPSVAPVAFQSGAGLLRSLSNSHASRARTEATRFAVTSSSWSSLTVSFIIPSCLSEALPVPCCGSAGK